MPPGLADRPQAAVDAATYAEAAAHRAGSWRHLAASLSIRAAALVDLGRIAEAIGVLDESVEVQRRAQSPRIGVALMRRAELHKKRGDRERARQDIREVLERAQRSGAASDAAMATLWLAIEEHEAGREGADRVLSDTASAARSLLEPSLDGRALLAAARAILDKQASGGH